MPMDGIGKPNLSSNLKTGFRLMSSIRKASPQKATVKGEIASNHPIASVRGALGKKKKKAMY